MPLLSKKMNPTSCELDPVPTHLFINCLDTILPVLTRILNDSLHSGVFPQIFKTAVIKPLLKKPTLDPNDLKNYRPVSNLPFISKVLEKIVLNQLLNHLKINKLLPCYQSAYRAAHSTETALLRILNDLLVANDESKISVLVLLDLSAAFDTIDHSILLSRLHHTFGITDTCLAFLRSYLTDRTQFVSVSGSTSNLVPLRYGVPQGSVLGPVLFLLYTQPLAGVIEHHSVSHSEYADDTQLYDSAVQDQLPSMLTNVEQCIINVKDWMTKNKLQLNDSKTEALLISSKTSCNLPHSLSVCGTPVPIVSSARNLGVMFDSSAAMKTQINKVCQACYLEIRRIGSIRHFLTTEATKVLVTSLILSRIDYCNSLLAGLPQSLLESLQKVQNCAARLIFKSRRSDHVTPLLMQLHWLPVSYRIQYKLSVLCYQIIRSFAPLYLSDLTKIYVPSRSLRSSADERTFKIPLTKKKYQGQRAFSFAGPVTWNSLPRELRYAETLCEFKCQLKTHLFSKAFESHISSS